MTLLNMSSLRGLFADTVKKVSNKKTAFQKLNRKLAVDSLEDRILLSVTPTGAADILVNTEFSQDQNTNANGNAVAVDADGDFVVTWTRGDNIYRDANRNVGWYDSENNLHLYTDRNFIDRGYTDENGNFRNVVLTPYIAPETGAQMVDYNIYARYFTDEVQRVSLDTSAIADGDRLYSFTLLTGDTFKQKISFQKVDVPDSMTPDPIMEMFTVSFGDQEATFLYNATGHTIQNARNIQETLEGMFGEGNVKVTAETDKDFIVEFTLPNVSNDELAAQTGLLEFQCDDPIYEVFVESLVRPEEITIFAQYDADGNFDAAATAEQITIMFQQSWTSHAAGNAMTDIGNVGGIYAGGDGNGPVQDVIDIRTQNFEVSVIPVYGLGENIIGFDITYVKSSGKQDFDQLIVLDAISVAEADFEKAPGELTSTNDVTAAMSVATLKQNSVEFRVNEEDDSFNKKSKIYTPLAQTNASVALDADGDFAITWTSDVLQTRDPGSFTDVYARVYSASMVNAWSSAAGDYVEINGGKGYIVRSDEILANTETTGPQANSSIAMDSQGNFTVVWASTAQEFSYLNGIFMQRFDANGKKLADVERVDTEVTGEALLPQVAMSPDGSLIAVSWNWRNPLANFDNDQVSMAVFGYSTNAEGKTTFERLVEPQTVYGNQVVSGSVDNASSITINKQNQILIAWNVNGTDLSGAATTEGLVSQYQWTVEDGASVAEGSLTVLREGHRVASAYMDGEGIASETAGYWSGSRNNINAVLDADGDFLVSYEGGGMQATQTFVPSTALTILQDLINPETNADLLEYFDPSNLGQFILNAPTNHPDGNWGDTVTWMPIPLEMYVTNGDVNSIISMILTRTQRLMAGDLSIMAEHYSLLTSQDTFLGLLLAADPAERAAAITARVAELNDLITQTEDDITEYQDDLAEVELRIQIWEGSIGQVAEQQLARLYQQRDQLQKNIEASNAMLTTLNGLVADLNNLDASADEGIRALRTALAAEMRTLEGEIREAGELSDENQEKLTRLSTILHSVMDKVRGDKNGVYFTMFDSDPTQTTNPGMATVLYTDCIANANRDGSNAKYFITFDRSFYLDNSTNPLDVYTQTGGSSLLAVNGMPWDKAAFNEDRAVWKSLNVFLSINGTQVEVNVDLSECYYLDQGFNYRLNMAEAAQAIENAITAQFADAWPQAAGFEGCVEVRALSTDLGDPIEMSNYDGTYFNLTGDPEDLLGVFPSDMACFEIQFTGYLHDTTAIVDNGNVGSVVATAPTFRFDLTEAEGRYYRFRINNTLIEDIVGESIDGFAGTLREALNEAGFNENEVHIEFVTILETNPNGELTEKQVIDVTFSGQYAGRDDISIGIDLTKPDLDKTANEQGQEVAEDPYPNWNAERLTGWNQSTIVPGGTIEGMQFAPILHYMGHSGTPQLYNHVGMTPEGDFTFVWTQENATEMGGIYVTESMYGFSESIFFRTFDEEYDTAGPEALNVYFSNGQELEEGGQLEGIEINEDVTPAFIVTFTEEMMNADRISSKITEAEYLENLAHSVTNTANWILVKDGMRVENAISDIYFGMNASADPMMQEMGITPLQTNKWEAVVMLNPELDLEGGSYEIILLSNTTDINGNKLNMDGVNTDGANWEFNFDIIYGSTPIESVTDTTDGLSQSFVDLEASDELWAPNATAVDPEGDTVTVWTDEAGGVFAQITYTKWSEVGGRNVSNEGSRTVQITDNATAYFASVAMDSAGDFVVTWTQNDGVDGETDWNIWARRFDLNGNALGDAFRVNTTVDGEQKFSQAAMDADGDFVIVWQGYSPETGWDIYGQRYDYNGNQLNILNETQSIDILEDWTGSFTLSMDNGTDKATTAEIVYDGVSIFKLAVAVEEALNAMSRDQLGGKYEFKVAAKSYTNLQVEIIVKSGDVDIDVNELRLIPTKTTSFDVNDKPVGNIVISTYVDGKGGEFIVNETTQNHQVYASVAMDDAGNFVVSWTGYGNGQNGDSVYESNIYMRQYAFDGRTLVGDVPVDENPEDETGDETGDGTADGTDDEVMNSLSDFIINVEGNPGQTANPSGLVYVQAGGAIGTGTLLEDGGNKYILTAAHVVAGAALNQLSVNIITDSGMYETVTEIAGVYIHEDYGVAKGELIDNVGDIAIIELKESFKNAEGWEISRNLYDGLNVEFTRYGFGEHGEAGDQSGVDTEFTPNTLYVGNNVWDYLDGSGILYSDFDDGTLAGNSMEVFMKEAFGISVTSDLGLGARETGSAHGDSGGPCIIDDVIVGICLGGFELAGEGIYAYGNIDLDTSVAYYSSWIDNITGGPQNSANDDASLERIVNDDNMIGSQKYSSVAMDRDGDFVITWTSTPDNVVDHNDIYARTFAQDGTKNAESFLVNTTVQSNQQLSKVAMDADGDFVITWESFQEHGDGSMIGASDNWGIYAQRYVANDKIQALTYVGFNGELGSEMSLTGGAADERLPNVAMTAVGDMVFTWQSDEAGPTDIYTRTYYQSRDDAAPIVVRFESTIIKKRTEMVQNENGQLIENVQYYTEEVIIPTVSEDGRIIVDGVLPYVDIVIDEQLIGQYPDETGTDSILNLNNWTLVKDGVVVTAQYIDRVELAVYGESFTYAEGMPSVTANAAGYDNTDPNYIVEGNESQKNVYRIYFKTHTSEDINGNPILVTGLEDGDYTLSIQDRIEDRFGNKLDGDGDGEPGGDFSFDFTVSMDEVDDGALVEPSDPEDSNPSDIDKLVDDCQGADSRIDPAIAMSANGDYVVVWVEEVSAWIPAEDDSEDGTTTDGTDDGTAGDGTEEDTDYIRIVEKTIVVGQRYNRYGEEIGGKFVVSDHVDGFCEDPDIAMDDEGSFVVSWTVYGQDKDVNGYVDNNEKADYDVYVRAFNMAATPRTDSFSVQMDITFDDTNSNAQNKNHILQDTTSNQQKESSVALSPDGTQFVVTWTNLYPYSETDKYAIYAQRYAFNTVEKQKDDTTKKKCQTIGNTFIVNTPDTFNQLLSDVAMDAAGNIVVTWQSSSAAQTGVDIYARRFNASNAALSGVVQVNDNSARDQVTPSIAMNAEGQYVIAWASQTGNYCDIFFKTFDANMNTLVAEKQANTGFTNFDQTNPSVAISRNSSSSNDTSFAISWTSYGTEKITTLTDGVYMVVYSDINASTVATQSGHEVLVNSNPFGNQYDSMLAMDAYGNIGTVWVGDHVPTGTETISFIEHQDSFHKVYIRNDVPGYELPQTFASGANSSAAITQGSIQYNATLENGGGTVSSTSGSTTIEAAQNSMNKFEFTASADAPTAFLNNVELDLSASGSDYVFDASSAGGCDTVVTIKGIGGESISVNGSTIYIVTDTYTLKILNAAACTFVSSNAVMNVTVGSGEKLLVNDAIGSIAVQGTDYSYRFTGCVNVTASGSGKGAAQIFGSVETVEQIKVNGTTLSAQVGTLDVSLANFKEVGINGAEADSVSFENVGTFTVNGNSILCGIGQTSYKADGFGTVSVNGGSAQITTDAYGKANVSVTDSITITGEGYVQNFTGLGNVSITGGADDTLTMATSANTNVRVSDAVITAGSYTLTGFGTTSMNAVQKLTVQGSDAEDSILVDGNSAQVKTGDYAFVVDSFSSLVVSGFTADDSVQINDTAANDTVIITASTFKFNDSVLISGTTDITVNCVNGGNDSVSIAGSLGAETFVLGADAVLAQIGTASYAVQGAKNVTINGNGGLDELTVTDTAGDDTFVMAPTALQASGAGYVWNVKNVNSIKLNGLNGGNDSVTMNDTAADERVVLSPKFVTMTSGNAMISAAGFANIAVNSIYGGNDSAVMYDSTSADEAVVSDGAVSIGNGSFFNTVSGFRKVNLYSINGGRDTIKTEDGITSALDAVFSAEGEDWVVKGMGFDF